MVFIGHMFIFFDVNKDSNYDSFFQFFKLGRFGVDYFFVLSGFLITWNGLVDYENYSFSYKKFLLKRILRIWPLYFLIVFIGFFSFLISDSLGYSIETIPSFVFFISFTSNFYSSIFGDDFIFFLVILWSIAIEFQFYLIWGLVLKYFKNHLLKISFLMIFISILFRIYYLNFDQNDDVLYYNSLGAIANFSIGSLVALMFRNNLSVFKSFTYRVLKFRLIFYIFLILCVFFHYYIFDNPYSRIFERLFYSILFGFVVVDHAFYPRSNFNLGDNKILSYLGKVSYGLYCYHALVISTLIFLLNSIGLSQNIYLTLFVYPLIIISVSILISIVSFNTIEAWFLKLKKRID